MAKLGQGDILRIDYQIKNTTKILTSKYNPRTEIFKCEILTSLHTFALLVFRGQILTH